MSVIRKVKRGILKCGIKPSHRFEFLYYLLTLGVWLKKHPAKHIETREGLYDYLFTLVEDGPFDYLEAGVFKGGSIRHWANLSKNEKCRFFGFDTFTGLPEAWKTGLQTVEEGKFCVDGAIPDIQDDRVTFIKGLFQDTVPGFLESFTPQSQLVVHCDADLYTSTLYWLTQLDRIMKPGTIILFDDFSVGNHDFRAMTDYTSAYRRSYELLATAEVDFGKTAIRLIS